MFSVARGSVSCVVVATFRSLLKPPASQTPPSYNCVRENIFDSFNLFFDDWILRASGIGFNKNILVGLPR